MRRFDVWDMIWIAAQVVAMAGAMMLLVSCSSVQRAERISQAESHIKTDSVWVMHRDTIWNERVLRDSVIVRDSVVVWMRGDSIIGRDGWHEVRVIREKADSARLTSENASGRAAERQDSVSVQKQTEMVKKSRGNIIWSWFWGLLVLLCCLYAGWEWWCNRNKNI